MSTAKDSDSSFDVEPVCSHVKRITWIIEGNRRVYVGNEFSDSIFIPFSFFLSFFPPAAPLLILIFIPTVGTRCDICHSSITRAEKHFYASRDHREIQFILD